MSAGENTSVPSLAATMAGESSGRVGRIMARLFPAQRLQATGLKSGTEQRPARVFPMTAAGWKQLLDGWPWFTGEGSYPLFPFSEFMGPVRVGRKPYGTWDPVPLAEDDPWGWPVSEYEEELTLRPGLRAIAGQLLEKLHALCRGPTEGEI